MKKANLAKMKRGPRGPYKPRKLKPSTSESESPMPGPAEDDLQSALDLLNKTKGGITITESEIAEMEARGKAWLANPELMGDYFTNENLVHVQILGKIIRKPPSGRSGTIAMLNAMRDFREVGDAVFDGLDRKQKATRKQAKEKEYEEKQYRAPEPDEDEEDVEELPTHFFRPSDHDGLHCRDCGADRDDSSHMPDHDDPLNEEPVPHANDQTPKRKSPPHGRPNRGGKRRGRGAKR